MKLTKYENNPILSPCGDSWESLCVLNPAVVYEEETGKFRMLYRAAGNDREHHIYLGLAESSDGINFTRMSSEPLIAPTENGADAGCVEDPRLVRMGDWYYLTYASRTFAPGQYWREDKGYFGFKPEFGPKFLVWNNSLTHLAISRDLVNWKKLGRITDSRYDDRDVVIFPEPVAGRFWRLSRPMEWCGEGYGCEKPSIWIADSDDLLEWDKPELLMKGEEWWEDAKIGASTPPSRCRYGWFMLYHGVASSDGAYRVGAVILDEHDPSVIIARTKDFIMEPELDFETQGYYNGCVFPTGAVVKDGTLYVYYGAADRYVCLATADYDELVEDVYKNGRCSF